MRFDGVEHSYVQQAEQEMQISMPSCYTSPDSVDCWRHDRMLGSVLPLLEAFPRQPGPLLVMAGTVLTLFSLRDTEPMCSPQA